MRLFFAFLLFCHLATPSSAVDFRSLLGGSQLGNSPIIIMQFDNQVEVTIADNAEVYTAADADEVLQKFLDQGANWVYTRVHNGEVPGGGIHAIGRLTGSTGSFRVSLRGNDSSGPLVISEVSIAQE